MLSNSSYLKSIQSFGNNSNRQQRNLDLNSHQNPLRWKLRGIQPQRLLNDYTHIVVDSVNNRSKYLITGSDSLLNNLRYGSQNIGRQNNQNSLYFSKVNNTQENLQVIHHHNSMAHFINIPSTQSGKIIHRVQSNIPMLNPIDIVIKPLGDQKTCLQIHIPQEVGQLRLFLNDDLELKIVKSNIKGQRKTNSGSILKMTFSNTP